MKSILLTLFISLGLWASANHTAKILETFPSAGYTYMKVQENQKDYWIAMTQRDVKVGQKISFTEQSWMKDFHSKTLNKNFDLILFASDIETPQRVNLVKMKTNIMNSEYKEKNTITVAELFSNPDKYVSKTITIKGVVTKISEGIMKRNWVHLSDGSRFNNADDIVFTTTQEMPNIGTVIYATGIVEKDIDFGFGYFYKVIVQNSTFK